MSKAGKALAAALLACAAPAFAEEIPASTRPGLTGSISLERHFTANAFDSVVALPDWYSTLRGTFERAIPVGDGKVTLGAAVDVSSFDEYSVEDDRSLTLSLGAEQRIGERVELRGSLGWRLASEGDDLIVQDTILGIRTISDTFQAATQAGVELGGGYALVIDAALARDTPRPTSFEADIIPPERLTPRKDRLELAAKVGRTQGAWALAAGAGSEFVRAGRQIEAPYRFGLARHRAAAEAKWTGANGLTIAAAAGAEQLAGIDGALLLTRPIYGFSAEIPLAGKATLRASLTTGFDTRNTDDPVASWLERREIEAAVPLSEKLTLGLGLYASWREYLTLGGGEIARGTYVEGLYRLSQPLVAVLRADISHARFVGSTADIRKADLYLGVRASM